LRLSIFSLDKKENEILDGIENHVMIVRRTVDDLAGLVHSLGQGNSSEVSTFFKTMLEGAEKSEQFQRDLDMKIAQGAFFSGIRQDILN
jgi:uncharacterized protein Yka (UPF0111/DUF47 family)